MNTHVVFLQADVDCDSFAIELFPTSSRDEV